MSVAAVDVSNSLDDFESLGPNDESRQTPQDPGNKGKAAVDRSTPLEESKPSRLDNSALSEIIRRAQLGDPTAFEIIYQQHGSRVYALCLRMLRDPVEAEDLTQEAFLQLFRKLHTFRGESAFSTWMHRLTTNLVLMHLRKKAPPTVSIEASADHDNEIDRPTIGVGAPDLQMEGSIDRLRLERCIEQLPAGYRAIFVLYDIQGYQHNEIAEMLGRSVGVSKSQLHKARMRLRELLHESQREKARNERLVRCKLRPVKNQRACFTVSARLIQDRK
jgi:RNA polymerase sigma-70 factor (ECF subfamily)